MALVINQAIKFQLSGTTRTRMTRHLKTNLSITILDESLQAQPLNISPSPVCIGMATNSKIAAI